MTCAVIIPAYNEGSRISAVIKGVLAQKCDVIVIDDGSADTTYDNALNTGATVLQHRINLGKGAAAKTGCEYALRKKYDTIILMDGDGQHQPKDIPRLLKALNNTEIVFAYREYDHHMPALMRFGNNVINLASSVINGVRLKDTQSGLRAMKAGVYRKVRWTATDYGMESEMIAKVAKYHIPFKEIAIANIYDENYKGTGVFDGVKIVIQMLKWRLLA